MHNPTDASRSGRARIIGAPRSARPTTRQQFRDLTALYHQVPIAWLALALALTVGVVGAAAYSLGTPPGLIMAGTAATLVVFDQATRFPAVAATVAVVVVSSVMATPFATVYAVSAAQGPVDEQAAVLTVTLTLILAGLLAHRTSRGRAWVTTLIIAAAIMFVGPFLLLLNPWLGFAWAWLVMGIVLFARGGGAAWIIDQTERLTYPLRRLTQPRRATSREQQTGTPADRAAEERTAKATACQATADLLADLPGDYVVFHHRHLTGRVSIDHIVVGPHGVAVVVSEQFKGRISEHPTHGLGHHRVDVAALLNDTDAIAAKVAKAMRLKNLSVTPILVIHQAVLPTLSARVALTSHGTSLGVVTITDPRALLDTISAQPTTCDTRRIRRIVARINRVCAPATDTDTRPVATIAAEATVLDLPRTTPTGPDATPEPLFVSSDGAATFTPGQQVLLLTSNGTSNGYQVTGAPQRNPDGITYLPVQAPATTHEAPDEQAIWFPLDSIQPDPTINSDTTNTGPSA